MLQDIQQDELQEYFLETSQMYAFFSKLMWKELSNEAIEELAKADYPEESQNDFLDQGYRMLRRYFAFKSSDPRTELACEYARIFLASGVNTQARKIAAPYESVFTSEEGLVMQAARDKVYQCYLQDGFKVDTSLHEPEDHLAFELEYMGCMSSQAAELANEEKWEELSQNVQGQASFIDEHLLNWLPALRETAQEYAHLTFYIGFMLIIEGFLRESKAVLEEMLEELGKGPVLLSDHREPVRSMRAS